MKHKIAILIIAILLILSVACLDVKVDTTITPTPTPHADTSAECYTRVYNECMTIGSTSTCETMAEATCAN